MDILKEIKEYEKKISLLERQKNQTEGELIGVKKELKSYEFDTIEDAEKEILSLESQIAEEEGKVKKYESEFKTLTQID